MRAPWVIIGSGLAGWTTVRELRKLDTTTPIEMFTADSGDFYAKPTLSNALSARRTPKQLITTPGADMAASLQVRLHAHTPVRAIDTAKQTIHTDTGTHPYHRLVLATGAQAIQLPLQGNAAHTVLSVNSLGDFARFFDKLHAAPIPSATKRVLILGAGLIGCEFANDLAAAGHAVTVLDLADRPLAALLPADASAELQQALSTLGVQWQLGTQVASIDHVDGNDDMDAPLRVRLANGQTIAADLVLSAVGLRPDTRLAEQAGLVCERGIRVDAWLQTSAPNVYSLGDGTAYESAQGRTLPYVMPIMQGARTLAAVLHADGQAVPPLNFGLMPVAIKTPALPVLVAPPPNKADGQWVASEPGVWQFMDGHVQRGFVLSGAQTKRRMAFVQSTQA